MQHAGYVSPVGVGRAIGIATGVDPYRPRVVREPAVWGRHDRTVIASERAHAPGTVRGGSRRRPRCVLAHFCRGLPPVELRSWSRAHGKQLGSILIRLG